MRRVLILAAFYPPLAGGGVHRVLSFTRHLPALGWACTVVTAGEEDYWVRDASLNAQVPAETEVLRVQGGSAMAAWLRVRGRADSGRRSGGAFAPLRALADWWLLPDSYVGWARRARAAAAARISRGGVDVVLSSSPPDSAHLAGRALAESSRLPWVADFRDPWVGLHFRKPPSGWHASRQAALETSVLARADLVLAASRTHERELAARVSGRPRHVLHLPNGFEPAPAAAPPSDAAHFRIAFTGTLSLMDDMGTLLEALERVLARDPEARGVLRVELAGPYDSDWEERARARGLGEIVRFTGPLAHAETRALQHAAELLLLWKPHGEGYRTMVPGKLYEYLDSGRPILGLLPEAEEAADLVRRANGRVIAPGDADALAAELAARLARWRATGRTDDVRPDWLDRYTRSQLAGELAHALDTLVTSR
jgi:glycosyltransferase involved in cell wall biosynthesis